MDPDKMRHCMSLGYSAKSKMADTIGQCKLSPLFTTHFTEAPQGHTHIPCIVKHMCIPPPPTRTHPWPTQPHACCDFESMS